MLEHLINTCTVKVLLGASQHACNVDDLYRRKQAYVLYSRLHFIVRLEPDFFLPLSVKIIKDTI